MHRAHLLIAFLAAVLLGAAGLSARAQSGPDAHTLYVLNIRSGPGPTYAILATLPANAGLIVEGRSEDASWLIIHTEDGAQRGWVASLYLSYQAGFSAFRMPVSEEILPAAPQLAPVPAVAGPPQGSSEAVWPVEVPAALVNTPILPSISSHVQAIFAQGQQQGNNPRVFAKVGDCNSVTLAFLGLIGRGQYDLGPYSGLQETITYFGISPAPGIPSSFDNISQATLAGYTAQAVLDPAWGKCGLSPLECEYNRIHPSVALIMLGLSDVHYLDASQYEASLRQIIQISLDRGVIPVLTTFPTWAGETDTAMIAKRLAFDTIVVNLAYEYDVPLINFWSAAQALPNSGLYGDLLHITYSGQESHYDWISFGGEEKQYGFTLWNLLALQTLDSLRTEVLGG